MDSELTCALLQSLARGCSKFCCKESFGDRDWSAGELSQFECGVVTIMSLIGLSLLKKVALNFCCGEAGTLRRSRADSVCSIETKAADPFASLALERVAANMSPALRRFNSLSHGVSPRNTSRGERNPSANLPINPVAQVFEFTLKLPCVV